MTDTTDNNLVSAAAPAVEVIEVTLEEITAEPLAPVEPVAYPPAEPTAPTAQTAPAVEPIIYPPAEPAEPVAPAVEPTSAIVQAQPAPAEPQESAVIVDVEIDNPEEDIVGEANLKAFVPGKIFFDYQKLLNDRVKKAQGIEEERSAIYNTQVWLLQQVYEVRELNGAVRPLGLQDVESMEAEDLAFTIADLMSVNLTINTVDEAKGLKETSLFDIVGKAQRFRIKKLSVKKAVELQQVSQEDPTGVKLVMWIICERMLLNNEKITLKDFEQKIDFSTAVVLAAKANFLLGQYQRRKTSFSIRNTRAGTTTT